MFRAVQTKRFYLYTPKWNVNRLIDAIIEFNEVELAKMDKPGLKPGKKIKIPDKQYTEVLEKLKQKLSEIEKFVGSVKFETMDKPSSFSLEEVQELLKEADEKLELFKHFPDERTVEKMKRGLEEVNIELAALEEEVFSSLGPRIKAKVRASQTRIFEALNLLDELMGSLDDTIREMVSLLPELKEPDLFLNKINSLTSEIEERIHMLPTNLTKKLSDEFTELRTKLNTLISTLKKLSQLKSSRQEMQAPMFSELRTTSSEVVKILEKFRDSLADIGNSILSTSVFISEGFALDKMLSEYARIAEPLITKKHKLEEEVSRAEKMARRKEEETKLLRQELLELAKKMHAAMTGIRRLLLKSKISEYIYEGKNVSAISGWIPPSLETKFKKHLEAKLGSLMELKFDEDKRGPIYIHLPSLVAPFRLLTHKMMGYPRAAQLDPTIMVSLLFPIMFGMMFGDIGHGFMLLLFGLLLLRRKGQTLRDLGGVLIPAGICSIIFGLLYGEVFLTEAYHPLLFSPIHEPFKMLLVAIIFGLIHLNLAFIANIINKIGEKEYLSSLLGYGGLITVCMYDLAAYAVYRTGGDVTSAFNDPYMKIAAGLLGITACVIILEPKLKGHSIFEGMMELFEAMLEGTIGLLANTLSYLRLAGFAIAHASFGIIAESMVGEGGSLIKFLMISGSMNLFAMGLEGMAAFIQASRLTLYEFMTKFFRGGGRPLKTIDDLLA